MTTPKSRRRRSEHGAVAIMVALMMVGLLVASAMVVDLGVVRIDRQMNKASADAAVSAGIRGLDQGDGKPHSFAGVCQALAYLKLTQPELADLPLAGGNVSCPPSETQRQTVCKPTDTDTHAAYTGATADGRIQVTIKSPYDVTEDDFAEESMSTFASDTGDDAQGGCDQLGVIVNERQTPGFGRIVTDEEFTSRIRSVGRVTIGAEGQGAVALLLLNRNECAVLRNASNNTRILVQGNGSVPGIIHSDSLANTSCSSTKVFYSQPDYGIIAEESEDEPKVPGIITTRALSGDPTAVASNAENLFPKVVAKPDPGGATGHGLITRSVVDEKYLPGVRLVRERANALLDSTTPPAGFTDVTTVGTGNACTLGPLRQALAGKIWIDCGNLSGSYTFPNATDVIIRGRVSGDLNLPIATRVYIEGVDNPYGVRAGTFRMNHFGAEACPTDNVDSRAQLVIRRGEFTNADSSSLIQLCNTAVVLLGGPTASNALPVTYGQAYTANALNGFLRVTGGTVRWTAPDAVGQEERTDEDFRELEDLALWTESSGGNSSHQLSGALYMSGVFMLPNARPFNITGNGTFEVENSQFIVDKLDLNGSGTLTMKPDPHDSITIQVIGGFGLVR